ncbi:MAG: hypothetical protein H8D22_04320, partial [Candidatus Cloacimonetes bacterium]|nr:hypothetical protein [Candidatus Cloacimonadota bacterium]
MSKKIITLSLFLLLSVCLFAQELQQPTRGFIPISGLDRGTIILPYTDEVSSYGIDYEFVVEPTTIMTSYYDYMPGGYLGFPIQRQLENGTGTYLTFHAKDSPTSTRRQYWAYYDENGNPLGNGKISTYNELQGFGDLVLHPATGNCVASWHENSGCTICYDDYALQNIPGFWSSVTFIPSPLPDEYLWPRLYTGPSPNGNDWIRIYHISQNINPNSHGYPCEDVRIMYTDIENTITADLTQLLDLYYWDIVYIMHDWREKSCQVRSLCFAVDESNPGKVGLMGYCRWLEGDMGNMPVNPGLFLWESNDYGATWDYTDLHSHSQGTNTALYQVENKPQFEFNGVVPDYLDVDFLGFHNTAYCCEGEYAMTFLQGYTYTDPQTKDVYYLNYFKTQAEVIWNYYGSEFEFKEVPWLPGYDSFSGQTVPWKIVQGDTILYIVVAEPADYGDIQKNAMSYWGEYSPRIQIWSDATYQTMAQLGYQQYDEYLEHPILNIAFSYWQTFKWLPEWYNMIELTDINNPLFDFSDQTTVFPNIAYAINYTGYTDDSWSGWNEVYLYYFDDNSYGSYVLGHGDNTGGQIKYCVFKFRVHQSSNDEEFPTSIYTFNTPNPFSTNTQISFSSSRPLNEASVKIYNAKGQLINTLETHEGDSPTQGYATWDGKDLNGKEVANGIYLYKV